MSKHTYIEVSAQVRYWEDATINGEDDADGTLTPFRRGELWCPVIRLADGLVMDWPAGMEAEFHFKVCDAGEYFLLDDSRRRVAKWAGHYVPEDFLCHGDNGYGDYIIFSVGPDGFVKDWRRPGVEWGNREDDDGGWKRPTDLEQVRAAAPALLDMLERAVRRLEIAHANGDSIMREWVIDARAAIATATQAGDQT
jgi:hypothetical protein